MPAQGYFTSGLVLWKRWGQTFRGPLVIRERASLPRRGWSTYSRYSTRMRSHPGGRFSLALSLNHFSAMIVFALLISIATAGLTQRTTRGRIRHAGISFALFVMI